MITLTKSANYQVKSLTAIEVFSLSYRNYASLIAKVEIQGGKFTKADKVNELGLFNLFVVRSRTLSVELRNLIDSVDNGSFNSLYECSKDYQSAYSEICKLHNSIIKGKHKAVITKADRVGRGIYNCPKYNTLVWYVQQLSSQIEFAYDYHNVKAIIAITR